MQPPTSSRAGRLSRQRFNDLHIDVVRVHFNCRAQCVADGIGVVAVGDECGIRRSLKRQAGVDDECGRVRLDGPPAPVAPTDL